MSDDDLGPLSVADLERALQNAPRSESVQRFVPSTHIRRLDVTIDIARLRDAIAPFVRERDHQGHGFHTRSVTRRPGVSEPSSADLSGRYWMRDESYVERPFEETVDESAYSEIAPEFEGSYVADVVDVLRSFAPIGRVRLLGKDPYNCNSWHRDPEPRLHIPIVSNPGSLFVVDHHVTHLPADGSIYFTDTRGYHTALNGGNEQRLSLVAAMATPPIRS